MYSDDMSGGEIIPFPGGRKSAHAEMIPSANDNGETNPAFVQELTDIGTHMLSALETHAISPDLQQTLRSMVEALDDWREALAAPGMPFAKLSASEPLKKARPRSGTNDNLDAELVEELEDIVALLREASESDGIHATAQHELEDMVDTLEGWSEALGASSERGE